MERKVKLQITGMEKKYKNGDGVENINIDVYEGEFVTMLGPSGCGKSTILRTLGGFLDIDKGDILIDGQSVKDLPPEKRPTAMVFQSYNLWPHMTVYENLAFGLEIKKVPKNVIRSEIERGLKLVNMSGYEKKYPGQLSGGQQQRVAIGRALMNKAVGPSPGRALFGPGRQDPGPDAGGAEADPGGIKYHRGVRHP